MTGAKVSSNYLGTETSSVVKTADFNYRLIILKYL